ncbi:MAG: type 1 glutamine amidotransferase [Draconibacterium sp.]
MKRILVINNAEPGIREFATPIENIVEEAGGNPFFIEYKDCLTTNLENFDGIILTGSPQGDDIVEHHLPYFKWIRCFEKPIFGICAGHHITGYLYGAHLLKSEEPESGDFAVKIIQSDPIFKGIPESFIVKQMHNDSITLPKDFVLLATSATCKNQLMKHKNKALYTSQFHPEFYNRQIIRNFVSLCS